MVAGEIVKQVFFAALSAVDPFLVVEEYIDKIRSDFFNGNFKNLIVIGFGKASCQMAKAVEGCINPDLITGGIIIAKYGHAETQNTEHRTENKDTKLLKKIRVFEAGHPIPDENGIKATKEIINFLNRAGRDTVILSLISGGGSALCVSPCNGITLYEKQKVTELLLKAGANITELNTVRKHISGVKGGRLAEIAHPAKVIALVLSDVIGDKLEVIASGPTSPDNTTFQDALNVINKFNLKEKVPEPAIDILLKGKQGLIPETPKGDNPVFKGVKNIIIGNNLKALLAAKNEAEAMKFETEIISSGVAGEARDAGKWLAKKALEIRNTKAQRHVPDGTWQRHKGARCLISGGETTVTVKGNGKGGRNAELALSFAKEIEGIEGVTLLSAGTDGIDGPTDATGAIVDGRTITRAKSLGLDAEKYLNNNDSYTFFKKTDSLLITGPTGTNVMDIQIIVIE